MTRNVTTLSLILSLIAGAPLALRAEDELAGRSSWSVPQAAAVRAQFDAFLASVKPTDAQKAKIAEVWPAPAAGAAPAEGAVPAGSAKADPELLDKVIAGVAVVDQDAAALVEFCKVQPDLTKMPNFDILADAKRDPLVRNNLRLYFGRWLAQHRLYDECVTILADMQPTDVVDPATLLFYRSVAHHRLLEKGKLLPVVAQLMENEQQLPRRYVTLAKLMEADIKPLKTDSLDEVARLMSNIGRHLEFGRAGKKVRKEEEDVIAKLDKMIEELEKQQQQQQQQSSSSSGGNRPSQPKPDSTPGGPMGPGNVENKQIGKKDGWGDLPPKEKQDVLQELSKDLPSHYREVIEQYFRKLARDRRGEP